MDEAVAGIVANQSAGLIKVDLYDFFLLHQSMTMHLAEQLKPGIPFCYLSTDRLPVAFTETISQIHVQYIDTVMGEWGGGVSKG